MAFLRVTRLAEADIGQIAAFIAQDNPAAAAVFVEKLRGCCDLLAASPLIGRDRSELRANLRSFPFGRYVVFYEPQNAGIEILRILHGARDVTGI